MTLEEKQTWIHAFMQYPTGNISDAMDALGLKRGAVTGLIPLHDTQPKTAGFAFTIRQSRRRTLWDGTNLAKQGSIIDEQTSSCDLLVIDMNGITDVCTGGAILALRAQMKGVTGELTNGCLRDREEIMDLSFPVYCAGTVPAKSAHDIETIGVNVPVLISGIQINPGDLILMDLTGVIRIPSDKLEDVLIKTAEIDLREQQMTEMIRQGKSLSEAKQSFKSHHSHNSGKPR